MRTKPTIALLIVIIFTGCDLNKYWGKGNVETRKIDISTGIDHIKVNNTFEITLVQDNSSFIDVICNENFQPKVNIRVEGKTLILDHSINNRWLNGYEKVQLEIHIPSILTIDIYKPTKISTLGSFSTSQFCLIDWGNFLDCNVDVNVNFLRVDSSGDSFGSYIIKGSAQKSLFYCRGSAKFDCSGLQTDSCQISQESILDLTINVNDYFDVLIKSSGDVYYSGEPTVNLIKKGDGKLIKQ